MMFTGEDADARHARTGVPYVTSVDGSMLLPATHRSDTRVGLVHAEDDGVTWGVWDLAGEFVAGGAERVDEDSTWRACARAALTAVRDRGLVPRRTG